MLLGLHELAAISGVAEKGSILVIRAQGLGVKGFGFRV